VKRNKGPPGLYSSLGFHSFHVVTGAGMPFFNTTSKEDTSFVSATLLAIAWLFLFFPCISTPVVDYLCMYRLSTQIEGAIRYVDVGFWGSCVEPLKMYVN